MTTRSESKILLNKWAGRLPRSQMVYPDKLNNRAKYIFWRTYTNFHPYVRDVATLLGIVRHGGRQPFLLGNIQKHSLKAFIEHLIKIGYGNNFVAWHDDDEIVSLRLTDGFYRQYHVRVFADGAVHGHYEYTPEAYPLWHINQIGFEDRKNIFFEQFGEIIKSATEQEIATSTAQFYANWRPYNQTISLVWREIKSRLISKDIY